MLAFRRLLVVLLLGATFAACSSEPDDDLVGAAAVLSCQANPKCSQADRELAAAYEGQCHEATMVDGKRVLIDHCIKRLGRYGGQSNGADMYAWVDNAALTADESAALSKAEDRSFHRP